MTARPHKHVYQRDWFTAAVRRTEDPTQVDLVPVLGPRALAVGQHLLVCGPTITESVPATVLDVCYGIARVQLQCGELAATTTSVRVLELAAADAAKPHRRTKRKPRAV